MSTDRSSQLEKTLEHLLNEGSFCSPPADALIFLDAGDTETRQGSGLTFGSGQCVVAVRGQSNAKSIEEAPAPHFTIWVC